ncbi:MAG: ADP-ribosylglycohydrolase family protein [Deltaproteobacteria bacterium]|jgi:type I restriction enzyme M protein|nr:ADP-ribosylglycohydrolase family protein [Deltaproteobacteria bacterium]
MFGAIIGDIAGSRFEGRRRNYKAEDFELFHERCHPTDDTVMTLAIGLAIMAAQSYRGQPPIETYYAVLKAQAVRTTRELGRRYIHSGYGRGFKGWLLSDFPTPYNSYGNGAAMRISPVGFAATTEEEVVAMSRAVTEITHNHEEGLKGAESVAMAIFLARNGATKADIQKRIELNYYPLDFMIDDIRPTYSFDSSCQGSVPQAIKCFLEATSFEGAIRKAISIGGDSDTIGAITGSIAEAFYGVPKDLKETAYNRLDDFERSLYDKWSLFLEGHLEGQ